MIRQTLGHCWVMLQATRSVIPAEAGIHDPADPAVLGVGDPAHA